MEVITIIGILTENLFKNIYQQIGKLGIKYVELGFRTIEKNKTKGTKPHIQMII